MPLQKLHRAKFSISMTKVTTVSELLNGFWLGFSDLGEILNSARLEFEDTLNLLCTCIIELKITMHFFYAAILPFYWGKLYE